MKLYEITGENGKLELRVMECKKVQGYWEEVELKTEEGTRIYGSELNVVKKNGAIIKGEKFSVKGLCEYRTITTIDNYIKGLQERGYSLIEEGRFTIEELQPKLDMINKYLNQINKLIIG